MDRSVPLLRNPRLNRLYAATLVSSVGDPFTLTVSLVLLYTATRSPLSIAGVYVTQMIASLGVGGLLAAAVDRLDRRRLIVRLELVRTVLVASLPFLTLKSVYLIYPVVLLTSSIETLVQPSRQAALTEIVEKEQVGAAVSLMNGAMSLGQAVGYAVAGVALAKLGDGRPLYFADAATFLAAAGLIATIGTMGGGIQTVRLRGGVGRAWAVRAARPLLLVASGTALCNAMLNPALLPLAYTLSSTGPAAYGIMQVCLILGLLAGSLAASWISTSHRLGALAGSLWVFGVGIAAVYLAPSLGPATVPLALAGFGNAIYAATNSAALLQAADDLRRGTVMAVRFTMTQIARAVGLGLGALVAGWLGAHHAFAVFGAYLLLLAAAYTAYLLLTNRRAQLAVAVAPSPAEEQGRTGADAVDG
jgi:predicted MFS family arabinose efflux permease